MVLPDKSNPFFLDIIMYNRGKSKVKVRMEEAVRQARQTSKTLASLKNLFLSQDPLLLLSN